MAVFVICVEKKKPWKKDSKKSRKCYPNYSQKLDDLTDDIESTIENAVEDAVEDAMQSKAGTPLILLTVLTQDGKSILPVHAIKAAALAEIEEMLKYVSVRITQVYKMK